MTEHAQAETENYFGPIRETGQHGGPYKVKYDLRPCAPGEESNHGTGSLYRQHCVCGWAGSWSRGLVDAHNGGRAHIRAARKKEAE